MRILWQLELFVLNPMHKMQFSKKRTPKKAKNSEIEHLF